MRKISFLSLLFLIVGFTSFSQEKKRTGFKVGVNRAIQRIELNRTKTSTDPRVGVSVGFFQEIPLGGQVYFQPEFLYNRMGGAEGDIITKLDYFSIPALFKYRAGHLGFYLGPQFSLLFRAREKNTLLDKSESVKDQYKSADVAGVGGLDFSFPKDDRFVVSLRYIFGAMDVVKNTGAGNSVRNQAIQLTAGFRF